MSPLRRLRLLCRNLLGRRRLEQEMDREVQAWYEIQADRRTAQGMSPAAAARAARLEFEPPEQVKERIRDARTGALTETIFRDIRYAARVLRKSPGFTLVAIFTLALGIGANTAIFSLINAVMLRLLPVADPARLVLLTDPAESGTAVDTTEHGIHHRLSYPEFLELRAHNTVFSGMLAAQNQVNELDLFPVSDRASQPIRVRTQLVSADFFQMLGVRPIMGRLFASEAQRGCVSAPPNRTENSPDRGGAAAAPFCAPTSEAQRGCVSAPPNRTENSPDRGGAAAAPFCAPSDNQNGGANPLAVISYDCWTRDFAGRPDIVGTPVRVGQGVFQIIGVAPPGFHGILVGHNTDVWFPIAMQPQVLPGRDYLHPHDTLWLQVMARLAPGISSARAEAAINVTFQQTLRQWAGSLPGQERKGTDLLQERLQLLPGARGASTVRGEFSDPLVLLMAMVGVVLLIACANIANLMLARANARRREIGVRLALGAARGRLIRQLLTESLLVALLGGLLGTVLAGAGTRLLLSLVAGGVSNLGLDVPRDNSVLLFTAAISLLTGLAFGLTPAIRATRLDISQTLVSNGRGSLGGRGRVHAGRILVVAQVGLSVVLLMGATLFVRSLHNLLAQNLGFQQENLLTVRIDPVAAGYRGPSAALLYTKLRDTLRSIPGVRDVTFSNTGLFNGDSGDRLSIEASPVHDLDLLHARWTEIGPNYFKTLGIPLLLGREIDASDVARGTPVCVVNKSFAETYFPGSSAIGKHITDEYPTTRETYEIIGVVADAREHLPNERKRARFYANLAHPIGSVESVTLLLRSAGDPAAIASAVRPLIRRLDPALPVLDLRTANQQIARRLITERLVAELAAFFGAVALLMAAIGLYGVMSYATSQRTTEIGIRMALGASGASVVRMVLHEALAMVALGAAIGLPAAFILGRLVASRLYGLTATDPAAIAVAIAIIAGAALFAGYIPAYRASQIDPMVSLRCD